MGELRPPRAPPVTGPGELVRDQGLGADDVSGSVLPSYAGDDASELDDESGELGASSSTVPSAPGAGSDGCVLTTLV